MKRVYISVIILSIILFFYLMYKIIRYILSNRSNNFFRKKLKVCQKKLRQYEKNKKKLNMIEKSLEKTKAMSQQNKMLEKNIKKSLAKQKYLQYMLNEKYDEDLIDINLDNNSNICIIMIGDEKIYPFYGNTIDMNYLYAQNMGYDFKCIIGRILDKTKYKPHFDRYKFILNVMQNNKYEYILYIDSDAFVQDRYKRIEHFIDMMNPEDFLLGSWDCGVTKKERRKLPLNSGVLLMKKCRTSIEFCNDILTEEPDCYLEHCKCIGTKPCKFYDQCVIDRLQKYHNKIKLLPYGVLQYFNRDLNKCDGLIEATNISFIMHYSGSDDKERFVNTKQKRKEYILKNIKCSVFILNYNRPHNIYKQLDQLVKNKYIDEIIVSNGHPKNIVKYNNPKVRMIDDIENNLKFYTTIRWFGIITECKNDYVLNLDDDVIPSDDLIENLLYKAYKNPYNIYGPLKRLCTRDGYSFNTKLNYNTILTPILMTSKQIISDYINSYFYLHKDWIIKHKGNCEDLSLNLFLLNNGITPRFVNGKYTNLDTSNGFSSKTNHHKTRDMFCKIYSNTHDIEDYKKVKKDWIHDLFD